MTYNVFLESDIDLAPITSSPVRRKRSKQRYYRGSKKKKRAPSKAEKELFSVDDTKTYVYFTF